MVYLLFSLSIRFGLLDLRFWWGSPRPRSTSAGPTEAPCAPSVCVTGKVFVFSCFPAQFLYWVFCHYWRDLKWLIFNNHLYLFFFSESSALSLLRSRRLLSRCSRHRHRARNLSKLCICIATIKKNKTNDLQCCCIFFDLSISSVVSAYDTQWLKMWHFLH